MKKNDVMTMFDMIKSFFPKSALDRGNEMQVVWWTNAMREMEMPIVLLALDQIFNNEKFEPTLATIKEYYTKISEEQLTGAEEGWGKVKDAIRYYGYMREKEALASLPKEVQEAVQAMGGWCSVCEAPAENENTTRAQFRDCLKVIVNRKKTMLQTSKSVVAQIENIRPCESQSDRLLGCSMNAEQIIDQETRTHTDDFTSIDDVMGDLRKQVADRKKLGRYA
nr:hypothetical protein [uncultured Cellulosilyticum sp.]